MSSAAANARSSTPASDLTVGAGPTRLPLRRPAWLVGAVGAAIFLFALAARVYGLGQYLTADDQDWVRRTVGFARAVERGRFRETFQSGHPGVPGLWLAAQAIGPERIQSLRDAGDNDERLEKSPAYLSAIVDVRLVLAWHTSALLVGIAWLCWRLFGARTAVLIGVLLAGEPFLVAHGQLFETDATLAELMTLSLLSALIYFERRGGRAYLLASGLLAGLAFSTKAPAILLFGYVPLLTAGYRILRPGGQAQARHELSWRKRWASGEPWAVVHLVARDLALWAGAAGLVYVAVWPAMWIDPVGTLIRLERSVLGVGASGRRWGNFFLGTIYDDDDVELLLRPLFYPVVTALRLSPITCVGLLVLAGGAAASWLRGPRERWSATGRVALLIGLYVVLYTAMMTISPKKLDRYLMPAYPALVILGALGLRAALRHARIPRLEWAAIVGLGLAQAALIASVQPYSLSFYNPLLGGPTIAQRAMIVGWGEGLDQVARYLDRQPDARGIVAVSLYKDQLMPLFAGTGARLPDWQKGTYFVDYINMDQRDLIPSPLRVVMDTTEPEFTVTINGLVYARVYRIPPEIPSQFGTEKGPEPNAVPHP